MAVSLMRCASIAVLCLLGIPLSSQAVVESGAVADIDQERKTLPILCGNKTCQPGEICQQSSVSQYEAFPAECVPEPTEVIVRPRIIKSCAEVKCDTGYECQLREVRTLAAGVYCVKERCPLTAQCVPINPCANKKCEKGYTCQLEDVVCVRAPCPPIASCVLINPCAHTSCLDGHFCTQSENDPTVAECVTTPCATVKCTAETECHASVESCTAAPCPRPTASCVPILEEDPCALVDCRSGYICRKVPTTSCEAPPCPKFQAACENPCDRLSPCPEGSKCFFNEYDAAVCSPPTPCEDIVCEKNKECQVITIPCLIPPCPTESVCVCKSKQLA